jgi:hypothetical protein
MLNDEDSAIGAMLRPGRGSATDRPKRLWRRDIMIGMYQRRTQKGMGRTEKTPHNGAAKNPRLLQACNTTAKRDMGEFFFISMSDEFCYKIPSI